jgi:hypothetical protein
METETEKGVELPTPYREYTAKLEALGFRGPMHIGNTGDFTYGLYMLGMYGRPLILQHDNANCTPWVPLTESNRIDDTLIRLGAYAEGDRFVLLKSALENLQQAGVLQEIADLLAQYDRQPMMSARFVQSVRHILARAGQPRKPGASNG